MASRILAQLLVAGGAAVFRAATQAWQQALVNAQKSGVAQEGVKSAIKNAQQLTVQEAQMILGVKDAAPWTDVLKRYEHLFQVNEKHGSFYLQSKVYRAKERLEEEYKEQGGISEEQQQASQQQAQQHQEQQQEQSK